MLFDEQAGWVVILGARSVAITTEEFGMDSNASEIGTMYLDQGGIQLAVLTGDAAGLGKKQWGRSKGFEGNASTADLHRIF